MGRVYLEHFGGSKLFSCAQCDTFLTNKGELISTRFTGATGRAYLFNKVVNLNYRYVFFFKSALKCTAYACYTVRVENGGLFLFFWALCTF